MSNAACTIVSRNYFAYAKTLRDSYLAHHPDNKFYILIVDTKSDEFLDMIGDAQVHWVQDLPIPNFESYAFRYDILELNTNVKPSYLKFLSTMHDSVLYIDPDIQVFRPLDIIYDRFASASIVLTPHITTPVNDGFKPGEDAFLQAGEFNLGFIGVKSDQTGHDFLTWWESRCLEQGYNDVSMGLFVDQKWVNLAPCLFPNVHIERSVGCNAAYWNLHERQISKSGDTWFVNETTPLYFFHFSGLALDDNNQVSKYQNRYDIAKRPDLRPLFDQYRALLKSNRFSDFNVFPYGFALFDNGDNISPVARRVYAIDPLHFGLESPFKSGSAIHEFSRKKRLFGKPPKVYTTFNTNNDDVRLKIFRKMLRLAHRVLGNEKYVLLLRYMTFIAPIRRQREVFFD